MQQARDWLQTAQKGFCEETEIDVGITCAAGSKGAWALRGSATLTLVHAAAACLKLCDGCARCRFVSITKQECSWYTHCDLSSLAESDNQNGFYSGASPGKEARVLGPDRAPWNAAAAAFSRSGAWSADLQIFSPRVAMGRQLGFVGVTSLFGFVGHSWQNMWGLCQATVRAWQEHANGSLVVLTNKVELS